MLRSQSSSRNSTNEGIHSPPRRKTVHSVGVPIPFYLSSPSGSETAPTGTCNPVGLLPMLRNVIKECLDQNPIQQETVWPQGSRMIEGENVEGANYLSIPSLQTRWWQQQDTHWSRHHRTRWRRSRCWWRPAPVAARTGTSTRARAAAGRAPPPQWRCRSDSAWSPMPSGSRPSTGRGLTMKTLLHNPTACLCLRVTPRECQHEDLRNPEGLRPTHDLQFRESTSGRLSWGQRASTVVMAVTPASDSFSMSSTENKQKNCVKRTTIPHANCDHRWATSCGTSFQMSNEQCGCWQEEAVYSSPWFCHWNHLP